MSSATELRITASGTSVGLTGPVFISGTQFTQQGAIQMVLLCALSGLAIIPVKCDSAGRIGSIA
jgi:hypothetical protein